MQLLLMIEQAYAANARVISTADQLMQTLLEI
jgi:flagellar hook-associated protein FlgK